MFLSKSLWRKAITTVVAAGVFVVAYEATVIDSRKAVGAPLSSDKAPATAGARLRFTATAYCKGLTTASGVGVTNGIVAADPALLPEGSVIELDTVSRAATALPEQYRGIYTVMDTGPAVNGRHIDIYLWSCNEALSLGRRDAIVTVLRLGWNPRNSR
jgi:3D (Asp-Asp-Asp) domain-containing protein